MSAWEGAGSYDLCAAAMDFFVHRQRSREVLEGEKYREALEWYRHNEMMLNNSHVVSIGSRQAGALPPVGQEEEREWRQGYHPPFPITFISVEWEPWPSPPSRRETMVYVLGCAVIDMQDIPRDDSDPDSETAGVSFHPFVRYAKHPDRITDEGDRYGVVNPHVSIWCDDGSWQIAEFPLKRGGWPEKAIEAVNDSAEAAVEETLRVLYWMESANVELAQKSVSRQVRRQAERKDRRIVDTVIVKRGRRRSLERSDGGGEHRDFSHQFEVMGAYHHVTRGIHVRCSDCHGSGAFADTRANCYRCHGTGLDPEKVKACPQWRERHPHSRACRREWVPPHVKGPEDAVFVPKVRRIRD